MNGDNGQLFTEYSFNQIEQANQTIREYHFHLEYSSILTYAGLFDREGLRQYVQFGRQDHFPTLEAYWNGDKGYGRYPESPRWIKFTNGPIPDYLQLSIEMLKKVKNQEIHEEGDYWLVEVIPDHYPLRDNPEEFFNKLLGEPLDRKNIALRKRIIEMSKNVEVKATLRISRKDNLIHNITVNSGIADGHYEMIINFKPSNKPVPVPPPDVAEFVKVEGPIMIFLFPYPKSGWSENHCHGLWTQRTIELIKERDLNKNIYSEIYDSCWQTSLYTYNDADNGPPDYLKHHPLILGAVSEDWSKMPAFYDGWLSNDPDFINNNAYYFSRNDYLRDHHHFGYEAVGLEKRWFFFLREIESGVSLPPTNLPNDRYYSARDWGYGSPLIDPSLNRLTFTDAIRQYNRYTWDGKRVAYLMLGHVLHLLQDIGHPDHARCEAHPGSSKSEPEIFKYYCPILATEIGLIACGTCWALCLICAPVAFGIAMAACYGFVSENEVGYERLIGSKEWSLKRVNKEIKQILIPDNVNYHKLFEDLGNLAKNSPLESILGCGSLWLPPLPSIPGVNPDIDLDDRAEVDLYLNYTDTIVPQIIASGAGLIQYFYEIVNYPPILEQVIIVQWEPNADSPHGFGFFANDPLRHCKRYEAIWEMDQNRTLRVCDVKKSQKLSLDRPAYVFLLFGPTTIGPGKGRSMETISLKIMDLPTADGSEQEVIVPLKEELDSVVGIYYWGSFKPVNCTNDPQTVTLKIEGTDKSPHIKGRPGAELDSNPATISRVDHINYPSFPLIGYEPGADLNHSITIRPIEWKISINPDNLVITVGIKRKKETGKITVSISEKDYDCSEEPYEAPGTCPVHWSLDQEITHYNKRGRQNTGVMEDFSLIITLNNIPPSMATIEITADAQTPSGDYLLTIQYAIGKFNSTLKVPFTIENSI